MINFIHTAGRALRNRKKFYGKKENFKVTHWFDDINDITKVEKQYQLILLDRDCTLQKDHAYERASKFEKTLQQISKKSEIVSNSSFKVFLRIGLVYGDLFPANKLVRLKGEKRLTLLRVQNDNLAAYHYDPKTNKTTQVLLENPNLEPLIAEEFKKPEPIILKAILALHKNPKTLVVGDYYHTDIVCGNLAGTDTAYVTPYKPLSQNIPLILFRYLFDTPLGKLKSKNL